MLAEVPFVRSGILWFVALALAVAGGLLLLALRPVFASASPVRVAAPAPSFTQTGSLALPSFALGFEPARRDIPAPEPVRKASRPFLTARVESRSLQLRSAPGSPATLATVEPTTEFGSPDTLAVVERRGHWLGVVTPALANGRVGWVDLRRGGIALRYTRLSVSVDLSLRLLVVKRSDVVVRRIPVGIGRPGSPTPTGRFAVTDKLPGERFGSYYGCCILALSAHQTRLPSGWTGGSRVAIHGTSDPSSIGVPSSAGCLHAAASDLRLLMRELPLGTLVTIHA